MAHGSAMRYLLDIVRSGGPRWRDVGNGGADIRKGTSSQAGMWGAWEQGTRLVPGCREAARATQVVAARRRRESVLPVPRT